MNRRGFLGLLASGIAGLAVNAVLPDPERLAWVPGQKTHILPPPKGWKTGPQGLAFHKDAFVFGMEDVPLEEFQARYIDDAVKALADKIDQDALRAFHEATVMGQPGAVRLASDPESGLSIRFVREFHMLPTRLDVLYGMRSVSPARLIVIPEGA